MIRIIIIRLFLIILSIWSYQTVFSQKSSYEIKIDGKDIAHTMKGGIGASWHSLVFDLPLENHKYTWPADTVSPRGSAWGGNPPLSDIRAWNQVYEHARWLGLDFLRVELDQRMYEPQRNRFDWDNEEMKVLFRILDWCQENDADVFLQQMWGHVEWNSFPGVNPLISAPRSLDDFATGIATLLDYLTRVKNYTCIKYFCITNEPPGGTWGSWWRDGKSSPPVTPAWKAVREKLDSMNISLPLSGPDWTDLPPFDASKIDFDQYIGAYDIHSYQGIDQPREQRLADWVNWAAARNKPFFLTEIGNMKLGWRGTNPGPKTFAASMSNVSDVIKALNLGVDAINRWSFVNRGDLDGQWQLIRTYDFENKKYLSEIKPEKEAYYGYAMVTRFLKKYASIINVKDEKLPDGLQLAALRNTDGSFNIIILNKNPGSGSINMVFEKDSFKKPLYKYQVNKESIANENFRLEPSETIRKNSFTVSLLPQSITVLSNYNLRHEDFGKISDKKE
jgi:hypothetical protein